MKASITLTENGEPASRERMAQVLVARALQALAGISPIDGRPEDAG